MPRISVNDSQECPFCGTTIYKHESEKCPKCGEYPDDKNLKASLGLDEDEM